MRRERNENLQGNARELRKNMTPEEKRLWYEFLSPYPVRFRRQEILGEYIADFYCREAKIIIEIDGAQHYLPESIEYDKKRTEYFSDIGVEVIRFLNKDINCNFKNVCAYIDKIVKQRVG
ncbi:MAG: endonuclease domain-containing protein [Oscillospiraceae bacterium]|nr:endonuclease domain-containing protein [Oscillospiraceae bacterium]MBQ4643241.1 endonuclease domain-containing protein [Oscillospiraceae bacterium]